MNSTQLITDITKIKTLKVLNILTIILTTLVLTALSLVFKFVTIGPIIMGAGTIITPVIYILEDIINEVYGYTISKRIIWCILFCQLLFAVLLYFLIKFPSPHYWNHQADYNFVLGHLWWVALVNTIALPMGAFTNVILLSKLKNITHGRFFWLRSVAASSLGELVFCVLGVLGDFYNIVDFEKMVIIILSIYIIKVSLNAILSYPAIFIVNIIKKIEQIDIYDLETNFNPFKFSNKK